MNKINTDNSNNEKTEVVTFRDVFNWAESIIFPLICVMIFMIFGARINQVFGISMEPTLHEGDKIIVLSLKEPDYGDIVIINALNLPNEHTGEMGEPIVKRIIGLGGDKIFIDAETGGVYRNNELIIENYIMEKIMPEHIGNQLYPLIVPENAIFVLGDNRNHSTDSRITYENGAEYYVGCVDKRYVIGVAAFRIFPFENLGTFDKIS